MPAEGKSGFPVENRAAAGEIQDREAVGAYFSQFPANAEGFLRLASDFHFLLFLLRNDWGHRFEEAEVQELAQAVRSRDADGAWRWAQTSQGWAQIGELLAADARTGGAARAAQSSSSASAAGAGASIRPRRTVATAAAASANFVAPPPPRAVVPRAQDQQQRRHQLDEAEMVVLDDDDDDEEVAPPQRGPAAAANDSVAEIWACEHCTFENVAVSGGGGGAGPESNCEMCGLPRVAN